MNVRLGIIVALLIIGWGLYFDGQAIAPLFWGLAMALAAIWAVMGRRGGGK